MTEVWKPARYIHILATQDLPGYYVSNLGRVKGPHGLLKTWKNNKGHVCTSFGRKHAGVALGRVILATWRGAPPSPNLGTFYRDGDHDNLDPNNLSWGAHVRVSRPGVKGLRWAWEPYDR